MEALGQFAEVVVVLTLASFGLIIFLGALTGRLETRGLLDDKVHGSLDPGRVQLLVLTLSLAVMTLLSLDDMRKTGVVRLPSADLLYLLGVSEGIYLVRKVLQSFHITLRRSPHA